MLATVAAGTVNWFTGWKFTSESMLNLESKEK